MKEFKEKKEDGMLLKALKNVLEKAAEELVETLIEEIKNKLRNKSMNYINRISLQIDNDSDIKRGESAMIVKLKMPKEMMDA